MRVKLLSKLSLRLALCPQACYSKMFSHTCASRGAIFGEGTHVNRPLCIAFHCGDLLLTLPWCRLPVSTLRRSCVALKIDALFRSAKGCYRVEPAARQPATRIGRFVQV